jgi:hypothetical protein
VDQPVARVLVARLTWAFKKSGPNVDNAPVNLQRCPYDSTPITARAFSGGFLMLSCDRCGAAWEVHNTLVRRVIEPEWDEVRRARETPATLDLTHRTTVQ